VVGSGPRLQKYLISYCPGLEIISDVLLCSPLIATSLGKHDTVELAIPRGYDSRCVTNY
jgi:hypothetical protein